MEGYSNRVYFMDSMRSVLMLLGVVIHASNLFATKKEWLIYNKSSTIIADYMINIIHIFRMPTFFVISGYFFIVTIKKYNFKKFFNTRFKRLILPLLSTALTLNILQYILLCKYNRTEIMLKYYLYDGKWVSHLWFLNNLIIYFTIFYMLYLITSKYYENKKISKIYKYLINVPMPLLIIIIPFLSILILSLNHIGFPLYYNILNVSDVYDILKYVPYFMFGFIISQSHDLLYSFIKLNKLFIYTVFLISLLIKYENINNIIINTYAESIIVLASIYFFFYIFNKFLNRDSKKWRYLSDASYTVYLFHHFIVICIGYILFNYEINPYIGLLSTIIITFITTIYIHNNFILKYRLLSILYNGK